MYGKFRSERNCAPNTALQKFATSALSAGMSHSTVSHRTPCSNSTMRSTMPALYIGAALPPLTKSDRRGYARSVCTAWETSEKHLVSECSALNGIRLMFPHLFTGFHTMSSFMNQVAQRDVMHFIILHYVGSVATIQYGSTADADGNYS